jgi:transposase
MTSSLEPNKGSNFYGTSQVEAFEKTIGASGSNSTSGTTLTEIFGIGPILAARIIGAVRNVARFPTKARFASYCGKAPVEASSGQAVRHRLSLPGNRKLNYALHMVAVCQARSDARGCAYYRKKIAEGKSRKEALRCLKRRISDAVFKSLMADSQAPSSSAA